MKILILINIIKPSKNSYKNKILLLTQLIILNEYLENKLLNQNTLPPSVLPPSVLPPSVLPPSALPPGALPPSALPPGALPPSALPYFNSISYIKYNSRIQLLNEEDPTNYGHNNIIWLGNVNFPKSVDLTNVSKSNSTSNDSGYNSGGVYGYNTSNGTDYNSGGVYGNSDYGSIISNKYIPFNKQDEVLRAYNNNELSLAPNQKDYFELFRYGINKLNKPNDNDGPTLSISLFMPNSSLYNKNTEEKSYYNWVSRYFQNHLMLCIVFNTYFPNGNYRIYFDYYTLSKFSKITGDSDYLKITKYITKFDYSDNINNNNENVIKIQKLLKLYYDELKKYENFPYKNGLERVIHAFDLANRVVINNDKLDIREKTGDFFVYKFKGPFIENANQYNEGHITDGYIGQIVRFISLKQKNYIWNSEEIKKPKHIVLRDAHTNCSLYNDYLWINEINYFSKSNEIYFLQKSPGYVSQWHDFSICDNNYYQISALAGIIQITNSIISDNDLIYLQTIGLPFIINNSNKDYLPIVYHRPTVSHIYYNTLNEYKYGIDEYIITSLYIVEKINKNIILFNYNGEWEAFNLFEPFVLYNNSFDDYYYYKNIALIFIIKYLLNYNKINIVSNLYDIIKAIELLREDTKFDNNIGYLLSLIPNQYHNKFTVFNNNIVTNNINLNDKIREFFTYHKYILHKFKGDLSVIDKLNKITKENLDFFGLNCKNNAITMNILNWCHYPYLTKDMISKFNCPSANFFSGYYNELPPSLDIGILRKPSDLKYVIEARNNNKLKNRLSKSDYKLKVESDKFKKLVDKNIDGHINTAVQNIIFKYGKIYDNFTEGEKIANEVEVLELTSSNKSNVFNSLIWKALNYSYYDVPPEWFHVELSKNEDYRKFNELVKKLSNINGWAEYAINVLSNDNNDLVLSQVKEKSDYYQSISHNYNNLKMSMYESKYRKYKEKYLALKKESKL